MLETLGPYQILSTLGQGGMGVVYRARHRDGGPEVAVKTTRHASPEEVSRIRSEIHALAAVRHPGIVQFIAHGAVAGVPWYAMVLLQGGTLRVLVKELWPPTADTQAADGSNPSPGRSSDTWNGGEEPALPEVSREPAPVPPRKAQAAGGRLGEVLTLCYRLCAPLSVMHARGLVHRDLKPENVFLRGGVTPVLMDLGLVAMAGGSIGRERLDEGGRVLGTLAYMAPEQAEGGLVDARADLYALGAMLYELVTGQPSVRSGPLAQMLQEIRLETPPLPSLLVDGVPPGLDELLLRLLAKAPSQRFGHADDVARALVELGAEESVSAVPAATSAYLYRPSLRGRDEPRAQLTAKIDALKAGRGGVVVIAGESGAGKTFLALEAASLAGRRRLGLLTGECLPVSVGEDGSGDMLGAPLHPFRRFLQACADQCREQGAEFAERLLGARARILAPYEPALLSTTAYASHAVPEALGGELSRDRVVNALRDTLEAWVREEGPLVLVLDDLQWTDELSFAALRTIDAEFLATTPLLVICTWRSDEVGPAHEQFAAQPQVVKLHLPRLDRGAVAEMVGDMLAMGSPPPHLVDFLAKETEGNPFFVAEYLRMAANEQLLCRQRGRWVLSVGGDVARLPAPGSLQALVSRRIAGLSALTLRVLQVAAVLGRHVRSATLLGALGSTDIHVAIEELESRQILEVEDGGWRFVHDKLREAAFLGVAEAQRPALHRAAAEALVAGRESVSDDAFEWAALARHWMEADEPARAVQAWSRAGEQATRNFSTGEAKEAFRSALALADRAGASEMERARWESGYADACLLSGDTRAGIEHARLALLHTGFALPRTNAGWFLGFMSQFVTRVAQAYVPGAFVQAEPARQERTGLAAYTSQRLLEPYFLSNQPLQGLYVGLRCINLGERVPDSVALTRGLGFMSMLVGATPLRAVADRWAERAVKLAEAGGKRDALVYVLNRGSSYHIAMGRWDSVVANSIRARDLAAEIGDRRGFEEAHTVWGQALHGAGRLAEALDVIQAMRAAASKRGDRETLAMALVKFTENMVKRGRSMDALEAYALALPDMPMHGEGIQAYFHGVAAEACVQAGDLPRARALADEATAVLKKTPPAGYFSAPGLVSGAHAYLALHHKMPGAETLAGAEAMSTWLVGQARMYPYATPGSLRIAGEVSMRKGKQAAALRQFERAVASARQLAMPIEEAQALLALARYGPEARRAGHEAEAARVLGPTGARDWFAAIG